ncbi:MAG: hypothetical protein AAB931_00010 [Patescibacteria group bacterium]
MGELGESPKPLEEEKTIKDKAIERHYDVVTNPNIPISSKEHIRSLHALGILGRDRGKGIIVNTLDRLLREKPKNETNK